MKRKRALKRDLQQDAVANRGGRKMQSRCKNRTQFSSYAVGPSLPGGLAAGAGAAGRWGRDSHQRGEPRSALRPGRRPGRRPAALPRPLRPGCLPPTRPEPSPGGNERVSKRCFLRDQDPIAPGLEMSLGPLGNLPQLLDGSHFGGGGSHTWLAQEFGYPHRKLLEGRGR